MANAGIGDIVEEEGVVSNFRGAKRIVTPTSVWPNACVVSCAASRSPITLKGGVHSPYATRKSPDSGRAAGKARLPAVVLRKTAGHAISIRCDCRLGDSQSP